MEPERNASDFQRLSSRDVDLVEDLVAACGPRVVDIANVPVDGLLGTIADYSEQVAPALDRPGIRWRFDLLASQFEATAARVQRYGFDPIDVRAWPQEPLDRNRRVGAFRDFLSRLLASKPRRELNDVERNILDRLVRAAGEPVLTADLDHAAGLRRSNANDQQRRKRAISELASRGLIEQAGRGRWRSTDICGGLEGTPN